MGSPIFLGYDRAALDREYNNRGKVADFADYLARYTRESEATRRALPCRLDLPYGTKPGETLDVFPAPGPGPAPIHLFVHGGYWMALDKADFSFVARAFHGAAPLSSSSTTLIPTVDMDELVRQCRARSPGATPRGLSGRPDRIFVSGHRLRPPAAMLLAADWPTFGLPRT
jgi:arylformamidase